ncbi:hypothetical protein ACP4OV_024058 [Aristida adscensionis]
MPRPMYVREGRVGLRMAPNGEIIRPFYSPTAKQLKEIEARQRERFAGPQPMPDWGLEPAASSWIRLRFPFHPGGDPDLHLYPREEREPKLKNDVESPKIVTLMIWDLPHDFNRDDLKILFKKVDGIVGLFYSSFRHIMLIDFLTCKELHRARDIISGRRLTFSRLKIAFFLNHKYYLNREAPSFFEKPGSSNYTVCIEGFDSSLRVGKIRARLAQHFGSNYKEITIPTNSDGSSIGKAYIKYGSRYNVAEALFLNGTCLRRRELSVTECHEGWDGRIIPNGPVTGKRIMFDTDSDDE